MKTPQAIGITGASGLIGSEVCRLLEHRGAKVRRITLRNIDNPSSQNEITSAVADLDAIVHLAFNTTEPNDLRDRSHVLQAQSLIRALKGTGTVVTHISSYAVFDWDGIHGLPEASSPTVPLNADGSPHSGYAHKKLQQEQSLVIEAKQQGVAYQVLRIPLVYDCSHPPVDALGIGAGGRLWVIRPHRLVHAVPLADCAAQVVKHCLQPAVGQVHVIRSSQPNSALELANRIYQDCGLAHLKPHPAPPWVPALFKTLSPLAMAALKLGINTPGLLLWPRFNSRFPDTPMPRGHQ